MTRLILTLSTAIMLAGCAGPPPYSRMIYTPPTVVPAPKLSKIISSSRDEVWARAVPALSRSVFQVQTIDKESGFIQLMLVTADPTEYVDCGMIDWELIENGRQRGWSAPAAQPLVSLEGLLHGRVVAVQRRVSIVGNINLVFEQLTPTTTRVTATHRYVVSRSVGLIPRIPYGERAKTEANARSIVAPGARVLNIDVNTPEPAMCVATGKLMSELMDGIN